MARLPDIVPVTDLRQNSAEVLERVRSSAEPIVITQRGRAAAVLIRVEDYERRERESEVLQALIRGERQIVEGKTVPLDDVFEEIDRTLGIEM